MNTSEPDDPDANPAEEMSKGVYEEMVTRVDDLPSGWIRRSLSEVVTQLGKRAKGLRARPPFTPPVGVEEWLVERLVHTAGMDRSAVEVMTSEQALDARLGRVPDAQHVATGPARPGSGHRPSVVRIRSTLIQSRCKAVQRLCYCFFVV